MKNTIILIFVLFIGGLTSRGQSIWIRKNPFVGAVENRSLVIFTDLNKDTFLTDFKNYWSKNAEIYSRAEWIKYRNKKNRRAEELYIVVDDYTTVYEYPKMHARPREVYEHQGITFRVFSAEKKVEIFSYTTHDAHFDRLELVSSVIMVKYITESVFDGMNRKNAYSYLGKQPEQLKALPLLITDHYSNLSGIEQSGNFPNQIRMVSHDEILEMLDNEKDNFAIPVISFLSTGKTEFYRTTIMNGKLRKPIMTYVWSIEKR